MPNVMHPRHILRHQQRTLFLVTFIVFSVVSAIVTWHRHHQSSSPRSVAPPAHFSAPLGDVDARQYWVEQADNRLTQTEQATTALTQQLKALQTTDKSATQRLQQQQAQLDALAQQLKQLQVQPPPASAPPPEKLTTNAWTQTPLFPDAPTDVTSTTEIIRIDTVPTPNPITASTPLRNIHTYVPAGAFAKAVLLSGLDASAGVSSQANPRPVLLRITSWGTLPRFAQSTLKHCFITGAGIGDISSERAYIRLETLSCRRAQGVLTDFPVYGTVVGPDGKAGIKGRAIWREGLQLQRALLAGSFSGFASGIANTNTVEQLTPLGQTTRVLSGNTLRYGLAQGASNAMERLADYHIKRAEQYQPVIEIKSGTVVDVLFLKGFYVNGYTPSNQQPAATTAPAPAIPLTQEEVTAS